MEDQKSNVNDSISQLFVKDDYAPEIPFNWPQNPKIDKNKEAVSLIRSSCKLLAENSKYMDINYDYLAKYANLLNEKEINKQFVPHTWNFNQNDTINIDKERDIINTACYFIILQFGSGFRRTLHKYCDGRGASITIGVGTQNMFKKYKTMDNKSLNKITIDDISKLFGIDYSQSLPLKSLCDMIRKCIQECVDVLLSKNCNDFTDYIYNQINLN